MTLGQRQELFSHLIARLILEMYARGFQVRCGDFWAKPRVPAEHKVGSLHFDKCAADLNLMKDGLLLRATEDHRQFGEFWESLHPHCRWGGRYSDGNHYEVLEAPRVDA
jgi:hypothetical protein